MLGIYLERIECGSSCCDAPKFVEMVAISISTLHYIIENTGTYISFTQCVFLLL